VSGIRIINRWRRFRDLRWQHTSKQTTQASSLLILLPVTRHIQEIELIRGKVYSLEQQHNQMKAK
jgi:hypothetical protein